MNYINESKIVELEKSLYEAMLKSNVDKLDKLLSPALIFTNHLGIILGKEEDLSAHKSGTVKINSISTRDLNIKMLNNSAVVTVLMEIDGEFDNKPANGKFRFTRVWEKTPEGKIQIVAAHSSIVNN